MAKTTIHMVAAKVRGLLFILALTLSPIFPVAKPAIAQTTSDTPTLAFSLDETGTAVLHGPEQPMTVKETLSSVCADRGYGDECAKILLGMAWKESNHKGTAIGDSGRARGWFQIWYRLHHISIDCAEDLVCSANWTIDYLESNGYPKYVRYAVQCHNGCNIANGYAASAMRHGERLWNQEEASEIALAK